MTENRDKLLIDLEVRIKQLMNVCDTFREENVRLRTQVENHQQSLLEKNEEFQQLKAKYDNLKMARTITASSVDVESAKLKLSQLVREVDKCINLLK